MTTVTMEWESRLGRRLKVRDLYILSTVVKSGSMAKAARQLAMSQPAVSEAIANLEFILGVRLLDRSPQGTEPTIYAAAVLKRSAAVFDELKQSVRDIEFLSDPTRGELRIGCPESLVGTVLPPIMERFWKKYPRVIIHVGNVPSPAINDPGLRDRNYDLILARLLTPSSELPDDLKADILFDDPVVIAAGMGTRWARSRKIKLADLIDEPWMLSPPGTMVYARVAEAFGAQGLTMPKASLVTFWTPLVSHFLSNGQFISAYARSVVRSNSLKELPIDLPVRPWPVAIVTLKNRTLSPVIERFVQSACEVAKCLFDGHTRRAPRLPKS
jgi:DNA-binding transcriptional LysR family regulator